MNFFKAMTYGSYLLGLVARIGKNKAIKVGVNSLAKRLHKVKLDVARLKLNSGVISKASKIAARHPILSGMAIDVAKYNIAYELLDSVADVFSIKNLEDVKILTDLDLEWLSFLGELEDDEFVEIIAIMVSILPLKHVIGKFVPRKWTKGRAKRTSSLNSEHMSASGMKDTHFSSIVKNNALVVVANNGQRMKKALVPVVGNKSIANYVNVLTMIAASVIIPSLIDDSDHNSADLIGLSSSQCLLSDLEARSVIEKDGSLSWIQLHTDYDEMFETIVNFDDQAMRLPIVVHQLAMIKHANITDPVYSSWLTEAPDGFDQKINLVFFQSSLSELFGNFLNYDISELVDKIHSIDCMYDSILFTNQVMRTSELRDSPDIFASDPSVRLSNLVGDSHFSDNLSLVDGNEDTISKSSGSGLNSWFI